MTTQAYRSAIYPSGMWFLNDHSSLPQCHLSIRNVISEWPLKPTAVPSIHQECDFWMTTQAYRSAIYPSGMWFLNDHSSLPQCHLSIRNVISEWPLKHTAVPSIHQECDFWMTTQAYRSAIYPSGMWFLNDHSNIPQCHLSIRNVISEWPLKPTAVPSIHQECDFWMTTQAYRSAIYPSGMWFLNDHSNIPQCHLSIRDLISEPGLRDRQRLSMISVSSIHPECYCFCVSFEGRPLPTSIPSCRLSILLRGMPYLKGRIPIERYVYCSATSTVRHLKVNSTRNKT